MIIFILILVATTSAYELFKVEKGLNKHGFHRDLLYNITFRIDNENEYKNCSFVFAETIPKDSYLYLEEIKKLREFDFFPHIPMNIEAPASVSKSQEFMWRLPFIQALTSFDNDYVYDIHIVEDDPEDKRPKVNGKNSTRKINSYNVRKWPDMENYFHTNGFPMEVKTSLKFEMHMRYQPTNNHSKYVDIVFGNDTEVFFDCENSPLFYHSKWWKNETLHKTGRARKMFEDDKIEEWENILTEDYQKPQPLVVKMPAGDSTKLN